jgi:hypothetical protein
MRSITRHEIISFEQWERVRPVMRPLFMHEKERRRLAVGAHITLLFENVQTVWYQIEETLRAERIREPQAVCNEIEIYNHLFPAPGGLAATMMVEYPDQKERDAALRALVGIEHHVWLSAGDRMTKATFDQDESEAEHISAVRFLHFALEASDAGKLVQLAAMHHLAIVVDHPNLTVKAPIDVPLARALFEDLTGDRSQDQV